MFGICKKPMKPVDLKARHLGWHTQMNCSGQDLRVGQEPKNPFFKIIFFMKPLWKEYETHYDQIYASKTIS